MDLHQRQQFDFLLATAVDRFVERLKQRNQSLTDALSKLESDPNSDGVWLDEFVDAIFQDFLLDNVAGACFVLEALAKRSHNACDAGRVGETLVVLAKTTFAELLNSKTVEAVQQRTSYQGIDTAGH